MAQRKIRKKVMNWQYLQEIPIFWDCIEEKEAKLRDVGYYKAHGFIFPNNRIRYKFIGIKRIIHEKTK